jgi:Na+-driven multidrug efflux pump
MERFSGRRLRAMMLPLFVEQLLVMLVGLTDTLIQNAVKPLTLVMGI